jgi:hypothetical protein
MAAITASPPPLPAAPPAALHLPSREVTAAYAATLEWELFAQGEYQVATIQKALRLRVQPNERGYALDFHLDSPSLPKPVDPEPLQELALRFSALYAWVAVQASPTGELMALRNHEALRQAWAGLSQAGRATLADDDELTRGLLAHLDAQVQSPGRLLESLHYDYLYQALLPGFYQQPLAGPAPVRPRQFAQFFAKTPLWFSEQLTVLPDAPAGQVRLRLGGALDAQLTDVAAVRGHMAQALGLATEARAATLPAPHFHYEATYTLALATGLPVGVALSVYARAGQLYNKEYTLTISRV